MTQRRKRNPYKLQWFQATTLYSSLGLLFLSGLALFFRIGFEKEWTHIWLQIHSYTIPFFLVSFGALLAKHATLAWKANRNRPSGTVIVLVCAVLIVSGTLLYYLSAETVREITKGIHTWTGFLLAVVLPGHIVAGLLSRKKYEHQKKS